MRAGLTYLDKPKILKIVISYKLTGFLIGRKKGTQDEKNKTVKMVIEETEKQIAELRAKVALIPDPHYKLQVQRYLEKLEEKKRQLENGTFYK